MRHCMLIVLYFLKELDLTHGQVPWKTWMTSKYELRVFNATPYFDGAKAICTQNVGYLMRHDDPEVNSTVYEKVQDAPWKLFWIGATGRMYNWSWLDGTKVDQSLLRWYENQPDNYKEIENRIAMRKANMKVGDIRPHFTYAGTICQRNLIPVNSISADDLELTDDGRTKINCSAEGFPTPTVEWTNISSSPKDGIYQFQSPGWAEIHFENATFKDEGGYKCVANNTLGGVKYEKNVTVRLTVPSHPTILKINPFPCNSSFHIVWKPHPRAIKVEHIIQIRKNSESNNANEEERVTPNDFSDQIFISKNLSSWSKYNVSITACPRCSSRYTYTDSNRTWGKPNQVEAPMLQKKNGHCVVSWTLSQNIPHSLITGFKVHAIAMPAKVSTGAQIPVREDAAVINSLSHFFIISKRPNKEYKVSVTARTCAGFGDAATAEGSCVTDVADPDFLEKPTALSSGGSSEDRLDVKISNPNEENGPISCIFVIVEYENSTNMAIEDALNKLSSSKTGNGYIAVALQKEERKGKELSLTIGDGSKSNCEIFGQYVSDTRKVLYFAHNKPLLTDRSYKIYVLTTTPSAKSIYFQRSEPLEVEAETAQQAVTDWKIPVIVSLLVLLILAGLVTLGIFLKRKNSSKNHLNADSSDEIAQGNTSNKNVKTEPFNTVHETSLPRSALADRRQSSQVEMEYQYAEIKDANAPESGQSKVIYENYSKDAVTQK